MYPRGTFFSLKDLTNEGMKAHLQLTWDKARQPDFSYPFWVRINVGHRDRRESVGMGGKLVGKTLINYLVTPTREVVERLLANDAKVAWLVFSNKDAQKLKATSFMSVSWFVPHLISVCEWLLVKDLPLLPNSSLHLPNYVRQVLSSIRPCYSWNLFLVYSFIERYILIFRIVFRYVAQR